MKKIKFGDIGNFEGTEFLETVLCGGGNFRLERILSKSSASPEGFWYDQPDAEFALVLEGFAELEGADGSRLVLGKFEGVFIPPHFKHRVAFTSQNCLWLALLANEMKGDKNIFA